MHFYSLLASAALVSAQGPANYFLRLIGGNEVTNNAFLHRNWTTPNVSPVAMPAPLDPADHYYRIDTSPALDTSNTAGASLLPAGGNITIVPTQPHPGPVASYLALSYGDNIADALRLSLSSYPTANNMLYDGWRVVRDDKGRALLRYNDPATQSRWIAVKTKTVQGFDGWAPWWVSPSADNMQALAEWEFVLVDIELVLATGSVNSSAPFGTN
ncbi:hypothetical protein BROUX41_001065 [Berkeleyomyces rouxiae]|uniref:uncharacterized protein n=1 Tax=Berkeleyomyces rouxiae TaxID=2035830 RepID=UPI003B823B13